MKKLIEAARHAGRAFRQKYNEHGEELPDPTPLEVPVGYRRPPTLQEQIKMFIRSEEFNRHAQAQGAETFDEANDFEVDDQEFDEVPTLHEMSEAIYEKARQDADRFIEDRRRPNVKGPPKAPSTESPRDDLEEEVPTKQ